jgi:shikimate kinase
MAHGAFSLLHALGAGYGCSLGLDLTLRLRLRDDEPTKPADDPSGVLDAVVEAWVNAGHEKPAENLYWQVRSSIPTGVGLKSSAALSVAAIRALCGACEVELENSAIVDIAAQAQLASGVSLTGSVDDAWAAIEPGWKVVDPNLPAADGVLMEGLFPNHEDWVVLIVLRGPRELLPDPGRFANAGPQFQNAITAIEQEHLLVALTENGRAVANALGDSAGRRVANDLMVWGARSAGITGSGSAVVAMLPAHNESTVRRIQMLVEQRGFTMIETAIWSEDE